MIAEGFLEVLHAWITAPFTAPIFKTATGFPE